MDYGARLKHFRERAGLSANALAKKVELDPTTIYKIESNDSNPSLPGLERICDALGITMAEFFTDDEIYNQAADKYIADLIAHYDKNPDKKIAADKLRSMSLEEQRAIARKHVKSGHVSESGVTYELFSIEETIEQYKSLPAEAQEAVAKVIRLFASNQR